MYGLNGTVVLEPSELMDVTEKPGENNSVFRYNKNSNFLQREKLTVYGNLKE